VEAIDMTRAIVASGIVMVLALGACAADPDQGPITPSTTVHSETVVEEQAPTEEHTVEQGEDIGPDDGAGILPEPGDGLEHPKSPITTMIVPPSRD
jgi:hypothetical protein